MNSKATEAQAKMLENAANNRSLYHGLNGQAAHGGATGTWFALRKRKWLDENNKITDAGRNALAAYSGVTNVAH